ncbi:hypothetical protein [Bradyrhizobium sp. NBAIM01]|uniref:hypothetical protein n=1 Tax=Bradyrhizobium sp. NBAIM01 TaxID=2793818 RepID=UPI001CD21AEC|nr:hypothetical protein [Bradyrhizobium sp. NBAIM01]MCA1510471.1 hypothetical protein [Bradyrhizobium sp. NBAIM01]
MISGFRNIRVPKKTVWPKPAGKTLIPGLALESGRWRQSQARYLFVDASGCAPMLLDHAKNVQRAETFSGIACVKRQNIAGRMLPSPSLAAVAASGSLAALEQLSPAR